MSWPAGSFARRCCWPTRAMGKWASSALGWTTARSPTWSWSAPTPAPTPSKCARPSLPTTAGAAVPRPRYRDKPCSLHQLAIGVEQQACVELIWRRGSKGLQRGRFLVLRVRPAGVTPRRLARAAGEELPVRWLLAEWPPGKPEPTKYWLASLPETTPMVALVGLARLRWRVEQDYRELKGALGLDHFEGRGFLGWHHHVTLVSVAHGFLTLERLRHPKPVASA
jgi:SRSO17 transposase